MGPALLDDHAAVGLGDRAQHGVEVERAQRAGVDHLGLHAVLLGERLRGALGGDRHPRDADDRHVGALAAHGRVAEGLHVVLPVGHLAPLAVERLVLDEDHGVLVADRGLQQALGVGGGGGGGDEQPGHVHEERLQAVGVRGPQLVARALGHAHHQRHAGLPAEHVVDVGGVVDDLVEREQREVDRHQLDHRAQPDHRGADAHADDRVLGDRGVAHAPLAELLQQAGGDLEGAAEHADVLAHQHHALVARELLAQRGVERLAVAHGGHPALLPVRLVLPRSRTGERIARVRGAIRRPPRPAGRS